MYIWEAISDSLIARTVIFFIGYIKVTLCAPCFCFILIFVFKNVVDVNIVLFIFVIVVNTSLIVVIAGSLLVLFFDFKGHHGRLSDLLFTDAGYWCNRSLFRLLLLSFLLLKFGSVVLLLLGYFLSLHVLITAVFLIVYGVATIVDLHWLGVYYIKRLFPVVVLELALALALSTPLLMSFIR